MDLDGRSLLLIFIFTALIFFSAYFSCSETAFSLANKIRVKNMAEDGNKRAKNALYISNNFERSLTAILVGNNIVNTAAASVATLLGATLLENVIPDDNIANIVITVATTAIVFMFGEMIPKSLASDRPTGMALASAGFMRFLMKLFTPFTAFFGMISNLFTRLFVKDELPSITEEELIDIIDTAEEEGVMDEEQSDLFKSAIEFSDTSARDVMTMRDDIKGIDASLSNDLIMAQIKNTNHSRLPVYDGDIDNIIGTLPIRSFIKEYYKNPQANVKKMLIPPFFVRSDAKIHDLLSIMRQHKFYLAIVSDESGKTLGLVTIEDFLEELVGEIWDEDDVVDQNFLKLGGNKFLVNTRMTVSEAFLRMNCPPPDDHIANRPILSWIIETFGKIPDEEESFTYRNMEIMAATVENNRVSEVEIKINNDTSSKEEKTGGAV